MQKSKPISPSANGAFLLFQDKGAPIKEHQHTFDIFYNAPDQVALWWNKKKEFPTCWFTENNSCLFWPTTELSKSNSYLVNTKIPHACSPIDTETIFLITFCRKASNQD